MSTGETSRTIWYGDGISVSCAELEAISADRAALWLDGVCACSQTSPSRAFRDILTAVAEHKKIEPVEILSGL